MDGSIRKRKNINLLVSMCFTFALLLGACSSKPITKLKSTEKSGDHSLSSSKKQEWKLPISVPKGEFYKVAGWLSENKILYITNQEQASFLYQYDLENGKSKLLYQSDTPIASVEISPAKKYLLIQSSPSTYQGLITITDLTGKVKMKESISAYELGFEWNPYNDSQIFISKFNQDWTFEMILLDIKSLSTKVVNLPQPFIKWTGKDEVAFLNYDANKSELFAPVIKKELKVNEVETIFPSVYQFSSFQNMLMTITVKEEDTSKAVYTFYSRNRKEIFHFSVPQLTNFSDWLVPYNDYNEKIDEFIVLTPLESSDADSYSKGFDMVNYNLKKHSSRVIFKGLKNEPLKFSPEGDACLYGNRFNKIINLKSKKIIELVKE
jgi:hypothetical protein